MGKQLKIRRETISFFAFVFIIMGAFFSYMTSGMDLFKIFSYCMTLSGMIILILIWPIENKNKLIFSLIFSVFIFIFSLFPMLLNNIELSLLRIGQDALYPITAFILILYGYRIINSQPKMISKVVLFFALLNGLVGLLASLGYLNYLPIIGQINTGRYIFGTTIPSSTGLNFNVNYFATSQASFFWLYFGLSRFNKKFTIKKMVFLFLIFSSSLIGSSRGVLFAFIISFLVYFILFLICNKKKYAKIIKTFSFITFLFLVFIIFNNFEYIYSLFRLERGLNFRDQLWLAAIELWLEKPIFGWGGENLSIYLEQLTGRAGSVHSGYFHTLFRGGAALFISTYGYIVFIILYGLKFNVMKWYKNAWAVSIIFFFAANSFIRTFSFGGLGLLPVITGVALSICFYNAEIID